MSPALALLDWGSGLLLLVAALYVASRGLRAHALERRATREADPARRRLIELDARVLHASASLQKEWVQVCVAAGAVGQLLLLLLDAAHWLLPRMQLG